MSSTGTFQLTAIIIIFIYIAVTLLLFGYYYKKKSLVPIKTSLMSFALFILVLMILPIFTTDEYPYGTIVGLLIFAFIYSLFLYLYLRLLKKLSRRDQWYSGKSNDLEDE